MSLHLGHGMNDLARKELKEKIKEGKRRKKESEVAVREELKRVKLKLKEAKKSQKNYTKRVKLIAEYINDKIIKVHSKMESYFIIEGDTQILTSPTQHIFGKTGNTYFETVSLGDSYFENFISGLKDEFWAPNSTHTSIVLYVKEENGTTTRYSFAVGLSGELVLDTFSESYKHSGEIYDAIKKGVDKRLEEYNKR